MNIISKLNYQEVHHILDSEKLSIDDLHFYDLFLEIGRKDMQALIIDSRDSRCLLLDDFILQEADNGQEHAMLIDEIIEQHPLLPAGFWKTVTICIKSNTFALVPAKFFKAEQASNYLSLVSPVVHSNSTTLSAPCLQDESVINVFNTHNNLVEMLQQKYEQKTIQFVHQANSLINGCFSETKTDGEQVNILIDRFYMHIIVSEGQQLRFYNQFAIKKFDDYVQYLMMILSEQELSRHCPIKVYGFIADDSPHFKKLKEVFTNMEMGQRPKTLFYPYHFDEIKENAYFDVFSLSLCK